ncbi:MAG: ABC transporter ATP-binding protein [Candidatus Hadarchaeales archaeon]
MDTLRLEGVTKRFGEVVAVDNIDLEVKNRELMVLVGPSGCGKSTLLRLIAGLEKPDEGKIYFDDRLVNDLPPKDRRVAMVFQDYALYPHMTVYDNMAFALRNFGYPEQEIKKRIKAAAELLGLEGLLDRRPAQLSGGQRQRVALGRAIVRDPEIYLWDEPLSNVDAKLRTEMRVELRKLQQKLKVLTIHVTHDQVEAMTMGDRIAVMKDGRIRQVGTPDEVYSHPADEFVAGFIGSPSMNFFDCDLETDGRMVLEAGGFSLPLPSWMRRRLRGVKGKIKLGVRPEDIQLKEGRGGIEAKIDLVEPMGAELLVHLTIGSNTAIMKAAPSFPHRVGQKIRIQFDPKRIHLFGKDGKALL